MTDYECNTADKISCLLQQETSWNNKQSFGQQLSNESYYSVESQDTSITIGTTLSQSTSLLSLVTKNVFCQSFASSISTDPVLLSVKQKVERFKALEKLRRNSFEVNIENIERSPLKISLSSNCLNSFDNVLDSRENSSFSFITLTNSSDDRTDDDWTENESDKSSLFDSSNEYVLPEEAEELQEHTVLSTLPGLDNDTGVVSQVQEFGIDDFSSVERVVRRSDLVKPQSFISIITSVPNARNSKIDFKRNYRTTARPNTFVESTSNKPLFSKFYSLRLETRKATLSPNDSGKEEKLKDFEPKTGSLELIQPILEELIKTEEIYIENLIAGYTNYANIFQRSDLPIGLRYKKHILMGNIENIAEFHKNEFLPMLQRNRNDFQRLFDEFQYFIDQDYFYGYVIFIINKPHSLQLCDIFQEYLRLIQKELNDVLGIQSLLLQPIQRMTRYPLLIYQFITTIFKSRDFFLKPLLESCCRLEKKLRTLLTTINESASINDIVDCNEFNIFSQGKFRKVNDFDVFDHTLKRSYRAKVFFFNSCIVYTEVKDKNLVFRGRYPCDKIGIDITTTGFTLFYEERYQQRCDFRGEKKLIQTFIELIHDMIEIEKNLKPQEENTYGIYQSHKTEIELQLLGNSSYFSTDSVSDNPKETLEISQNYTTWYV